MGDGFGFALKQDGSLWTWGRNDQNQLGDGTLTERLFFVRIGSGQKWSAVATKFDHTVALSVDGTYYSWGENSDGELGLGFAGNDQLTPHQVGTDTDWARLDLGDLDLFAIKNDGSLWSWGANASGELGDGTKIQRYFPTRIGTATDWTT